MLETARSHKTPITLHNWLFIGHDGHHNTKTACDTTRGLFLLLTDSHAEMGLRTYADSVAPY